MSVNQEMVWDKYILDESLFYGRETAVWRAHASGNNTSVILKILTTPTKQNIARLNREYRLLSTLDIDNVIRVKGEVHAEGKFGLVLEDTRQTLLENLLDDKPLKLDKFFPIAIQLAHTINVLHAAGIIHKDIKPGNILVDPNTGKVTLIDLSIAAEVSREFHSSMAPEQLEGTLAYMSPEQTGRINRNVDQRADLYSLGVTLYQMLTGKLPFITDDASTMIYAHMTKIPPSPHEVDPAIPEILSDIVMTLLAKEVSERYQTAHTLEKDLKHCFSEWQKLYAIPKFLIKQRDIPAQLVISEKIYGREKMLEDLLGYYTHIEKTGFEVVMLTGEPGIGKTAIIEQLRYRLIGKNCIFIQGKFEQYKRDYPLAALVSALDEFVTELMTIKDPDEYQEWCSNIKIVLGFNAKIMTDLVPSLKKMIGKPPPVAELDPEKSLKRLMFVLHDFINLIATKNHPLIIFLDDLQWADRVTLRWLKEICLPSFLETNHLMIIGAYREQEAETNFALLETIKAIDDVHSVHTLQVKGLDLPSVTEFIADTLYTTKEKVERLAQLLMQKTAGNPFYLVTLLSDLYRNNQIQFDYENGEWNWQLTSIEKQNITDNVIEFLTNYLNHLSKESVEILKIAACIGMNFSLKQLALIAHKEANQIARLLWPAIEKKLIIPLSNDYRIVESQSATETASDFGVTYRFAHDRVQQSTYQLLSEAEREILHYKIGKILWEDSDDLMRKENIIDITDHYNAGIKLVTAAAEKLLLANLNCQAAERAKASANCVEGMRYASVGRHLLVDDPWEIQYELMFHLCKLQAECAYALGDYARANKEIANLLKHGKTALEKIQIYCLSMQVSLVTAKFPDVVSAMVNGLALVNFKVPRKPTYFHVAFELARFYWRFRKVKVIDFLNQPTADDPELEWVAKIISLGGGAAYEIGETKMVILMCLRSLLYAANRPISPYSAYLFSTGIIFFTQLGFYKYAHEYATLTMELAKRYPEPFTYVQLSYARLYCNYWLEPEFTITRYMELFQDCWVASQQTGDSYFAMVCSDMVRFSPCDVVISYMEKYLPALKLLNVPSMYQRNLRVYVKALNEAEQTASPLTLTHGEFNEDICEVKWKKENNHIQLYEFYIDKIEIYAREEEFAAITELLPDYLKCYSLFESNDPRALVMALCKTYEHEERHAKNLIKQHLLKKYKFIKKLSAYNPDFLLWLNFLNAEFAQFDKKPHEATYFYAKVIKQLEADYLANKVKVSDYAQILERIGAFYQQQEINTLATVYLLKAHTIYSQYGYNRRASLLKIKYEKTFSLLANSMLDQLLQYQESDKKSKVTNQSTSLSMAALELDAILKAAHTISSEIDLEKLLKNLSAIILEHSGAEIGALIVHNNKRWLVKAVNRANTIELYDDVEVKQIAAKELPLAQQVIEAAIRSGNKELLANACDEGSFMHDQHIQNYQVRSIICMPLTRQNSTIGLIYLENRQVKNAFTPAQLHVLNLLSAQATVSLENALLFDNTKRLNIAYEHFVPKEFLSLLKKKSILDIKLGDQIQQNMTVMFADIQNFTQRSEAMTPAQNFKFINDYLHVMEPIIRRHHGFIDKYIGDAIMALFPGPAEEALSCAIAMLTKLKEFNVHYPDNPIEIRIGLNTGPLILGIVGGIKRLEGTVISDTVNLASRMEVLNKLYECECLISANTLAALPPNHQFKLRCLGHIPVRGKAEKIEVYEVLDHLPLPICKKKLTMLNRFEKAINYYEEEKFNDAMLILQEILKQDPTDHTAEVYLKFCMHKLKRASGMAKH